MTRDALLTLRQFDKQVARIKAVIERKAQRPYEILILSDHGQSWGPTFLQRYGVSILDFIQQRLPGGTTLAGSGGGDDGTIGVAAMMDELQNVQDQRQGGVLAQAVIGQVQRSIESNLSQQPAFQEVKPAKVTVCYGGNGAMVYFDLFPRRILLRELNGAYPGLVDSLVQHKGIGFVIAYNDDCEPVVFGKGGARNLSTGDVTGEDPLKPYGKVELRAWQLRRLAGFENAGDLILNSTLYPDGTVAALEELIGNHGGLGGEQTDAFLFHPGDLFVPETRGSFEFKAILDSRRDLPGLPPRPARQQAVPVNPWGLDILRQGLARVNQWAALALRALLLDREAYRAISSSRFMTGPALMIALAAAFLQSLARPQGFDTLNFLLRFASWLIAIGLLHASAWILRGKAEFSASLRVAGFAQSVYLLDLLAFIPVIGPLARPLAVLFAFFAVWTGASAAHELRGWRSLILPVIYLTVSVITVIFLLSALSGTRFALQSLLLELGWNPKP